MENSEYLRPTSIGPRTKYTRSSPHYCWNPTEHEDTHLGKDGPRARVLSWALLVTPWNRYWALSCADCTMWFKFFCQRVSHYKSSISSNENPGRSWWIYDPIWSKAGTWLSKMLSPGPGQASATWFCVMAMTFSIQAVMAGENSWDLLLFLLILCPTDLIDLIDLIEKLWPQKYDLQHLTASKHPL